MLTTAKAGSECGMVVRFSIVSATVQRNSHLAKTLSQGSWPSPSNGECAEPQSAEKSSAIPSPNCRSGWNRQAIQTFPPSSTTRLHDRVLQAARRALYSRNMLISAAAASWRPHTDCASPYAPSRHREAGTSPRTERSSSHFTSAPYRIFTRSRATKNK